MKLSEIDEPKVKVKIIEIYTHLRRHRKRGCIMGERCGDCILVKRLADLGFLPGSVLEILEVGLFGSPLIVRVAGASYAICDKVAEHIEVEIIGSREETSVQGS